MFMLVPLSIIKILVVAGEFLEVPPMPVVNLSKNQKGLGLYPNPVSGHVISVGLAAVTRGQYHLRVLNMAGQSVYSQTIISRANNITQTLDLPSYLRPGLYKIIVTGSDYHETKSFILQ